MICLLYYNTFCCSEVKDIALIIWFLDHQEAWTYYGCVEKVGISVLLSHPFFSLISDTIPFPP